MGRLAAPWRKLIETGVHASIEEVARAEKINASYVDRVLRLTLLAPEIIEAIMEGRQPAGMTMAGLLTGFPVVWAEQRAALGAQRQNSSGSNTQVQPGESSPPTLPSTMCSNSSPM